MWFTSLKSPLALLMAWLLFVTPYVNAGMLFTDSLNNCEGSENSGFTATLFDVTYTSNNNTVTFRINAISSINQKVKAQIELIVYGYVAVNQSFDPCSDKSLAQLCPLAPGTITLNSNKQFGSSVSKKIPSIAYNIPDLDGKVRAHIIDRDSGEELACVEARFSNGKTVDQNGVKWVTAIIVGLALLVSAVASGLGHSNTAAHVASNVLSLFGYFQAQALIGMTAVAMPPIVESWTANFQWTMGLVHIGFMQTVCTWYQRATGGTPSTILSNLINVSVEVQKRSVAVVHDIVKRGFVSLIARSESSGVSKPVVVTGIKRVGFVAHIEPTNIFLTGLGIFVAFICFVSICVALFKVFCEVAAKNGWIQDDKFSEFRNGWRVVLKGILFRVILIGYTQMTVLSLWELTVRDSAAEIVLAIFYFLAMSGALFWAAFKVVRIAKRSVSLHKNPAYILYSDPTSLNKWGFLYVQYRATAYYFIIPALCYILCKCIFVAFAQSSPIAQAVGLLIVEAAWLIGVSIIRPWMDKRTNGFNISIAAVLFLSTLFLLIFTDVFNQPGIVSGVLGVVFFVINVFFAITLLIMVIVSSVFAIVSKNPDTRYQPMRDDRGSFIKSQSNLNQELDALGATARGDMAMKRDLDDDSDSFTSAQPSMGSKQQQQDAAHVPLPQSQAGSMRGGYDEYGGQSPQSPVGAAAVAAPFIPTHGPPRHQAPSPYGGSSHRGSPGPRGSPAPRYGPGPGPGGYGPAPPRSPGGYGPPRSPGGYGGGYGGPPGGYDRSGSLNSNTSYRGHGGGGGGGGGGSPWQRGAGYDH